MREKIKLSMRISHNQLDDDIQGNIDACLLDLKRVGVLNPDTTDALILKAVEMYCKWQYDFDGKGERYEKAYVNLRIGLGLCGDYNV